MGHHYTYWVHDYIQPRMPRYEVAIRHKSPGLRDFPCNAIKDDGVPYEPFTSESYCENCNKCNRVNRFDIMNNLVNIQTYIDKVLTITLFGKRKELDKTVKMRIGKKYCVSYITENGMQTVKGIFKEVSQNVPDECTKYIGIYNALSTSAYIGMDCSTEGASDKRLIYISSIRYIEELFDNEQEPYVDLSQEEKLNYLYTNISSALATLSEYIGAIGDNEESNTNDQQENTQTNDESNQNNKPKCPFIYDQFPPLFKPPMRPWWSSPYIIGSRPPLLPPPPPAKPKKIEQKEIKEEVSASDILDKLNSIYAALGSFIEDYINNKQEDPECTCECCPHNNTNTEQSTNTCHCSNQNTNP